jgi:hypothetical protein
MRQNAVKKDVCVLYDFTYNDTKLGFQQLATVNLRKKNVIFALIIALQITVSSVIMVFYVL